MKKIAIVLQIILIMLLMMGCKSTQSSCKVTDLTVNYCSNPIVTQGVIKFGWKMEDEIENGQYQTAYRIVVASSKDALKKRKYVWDSEKIISSESVAIPYGGEKLENGRIYYWQVSVWDKDNRESISGEDNFFGTELQESDWQGAEWITVSNDNSKKEDYSEYNVQFSYKVNQSGESGFVWGADEKEYGKHYVCAIRTSQDLCEVIFTDRMGEEILREKHYNLQEYDIDVNEFDQKEHSINIQISKKQLIYVLDGTIIIQEDLLEENRGIGKNIGYWTARGAYYGYYDNLIVTDRNGNIKWKDNFEGTEDIFSPYYTKKESGWLEVPAGYLMTAGGEQAAPMMRKQFIAEDMYSAVLYASALGTYDIYLNGSKVGDEYFSPGRSNYKEEAYYRAYNVTDYIADGNNTIGIILGHGRYDRAKACWGDTLAFKCRLIITCKNGEQVIVNTDATWKGYDNGPIRNDDMFQGEFYDASYEVEGWNKSEFDEKEWENVEIYKDSEIKLVAASDEPIKCIRELMPISVTETSAGVFVYDFGQNINGICRISLQGRAGQVITMRYAEAINEEDMSCKDDEIGTIWTQNLYTAGNTDYYIMKGNGIETYEPSLVCRGFRYVQITGIKQRLSADQVKALVLSTDLKRTGYFECSDDEINHLYECIYWTQQDNFLDIPVDCPQRDERFGWAGDAQVFCQTASYNADVYQYMRQYVRALRLGQNSDGAYPELAPSISTDDGGNGGANGWSDAGIILTWRLYQQYADKMIIYENYEAMCRYMEYLVSTSSGFLRNRQGYNDHNAVSTLDDTLCNTAQCAYVASLLAKMSGIIGEDLQEAKYNKIADQYKKAWQSQYILADGSIECWLQSAYTLGLAFNLYPKELEIAGAACLNSAVVYNDYHLNTGYIATPFLLQTLCDYGYVDTAYRLIQQDTYPSWNYMFSHGATTITEAWNTYCQNEDGTYGINGSLNHYGLGSVGAWLYEDVLGIRQDENAPGFKHFYLVPLVGGGLNYAKGSYESVYGTIQSEWKVEGENIRYHFVIPPNSSATVTLPGIEYQNMELSAGEYEYVVPTN